MVLYHMTMSLDGFVTGPGDAMDRIFGSLGAEPNPAAEEVIRTTGAALAGRRSYDVGERSGRRLHGGAWTGPVFVLTHELPPAAEGSRSAPATSAPLWRRRSRRQAAGTSC